MRRLLIIALLPFIGCASLPDKLPKRPNFMAHPGIKDPADSLKVYYEWRLEPRRTQYGFGNMVIPGYRLPEFLDAQGDTVAASWAYKGRAFRWTGLGLALGWAAGAIAVTQNSPTPPSGTVVGALAILPAGLLYWTFDFIGIGWFKKPAAAKYNRDLKRELGLTQE